MNKINIFIFYYHSCSRRHIGLFLTHDAQRGREQRNCLFFFPDVKQFFLTNLVSPQISFATAIVTAVVPSNELLCMCCNNYVTILRKGSCLRCDCVHMDDECLESLALFKVLHRPHALISIYLCTRVTIRKDL